MYRNLSGLWNVSDSPDARTFANSLTGPHPDEIEEEGRIAMQAAPPTEGPVLAAALSCALLSALMFYRSIRMGARRAAWFWTLLFVVSSAIAAVFFWKLVRGGT